MGSSIRTAIFQKIKDAEQKNSEILTMNTIVGIAAQQFIYTP